MPAALTFSSSRSHRSFKPVCKHSLIHNSAPEDDFTSIHVRQVGDFSKSLGPLFGIAMGSGISKQDQLSSEYVSQVTCNCEMPRLMVDGPYGAPADVRSSYHYRHIHIP